MTKNTMNKPLPYFGGKSNMLDVILPLVAGEYTTYCEPFFGGGAVYWAKRPSQVEIINDLDNSVITFYKVLKSQPEALEHEISTTLHSRQLHREAKAIYNSHENKDPLKIAWAVWVLAAQSFSNKLNDAWGYDIRSACATKDIDRKRKAFGTYSNAFAKRLENTQIENRHANKVIKSRDSEDTLFYCDPPYPGTSKAHYSHYKMNDFIELLETLRTIKGRFVLSSYPYPELSEMIKNEGWATKEITYKTLVNKGKGKQKTEVITANFDIEHKINNNQLTLNI